MADYEPSEQFAYAVHFVESAVLPAARTEAARGLESAPPTPPLNLDKLPDGVVSGNTLIDYSAVASPEVRSGVSLAMLFAGRAASAAMKPGDDEDDWLATYKNNLARLGFTIAQSAVLTSHFKKDGLFVHQAIIPFLTIALGGAGLGPVMLAALKGLGDMDKDKPWVTLFDRESRLFNSRELHFAAVSSDAVTTSVRHVMARLAFGVDETSILFFRLDRTTADFESATTTMSANNELLATVEPRLRQRLEAEIGDFIAATTLGGPAAPGAPAGGG